jgi:uncharacterized protein
MAGCGLTADLHAWSVSPGGQKERPDPDCNDRVRWYRHADYERSLDQIAPRCKAAPGHLDWHLVRPTPGVTDTYAVIIRFATTEHLRNWMESSERERLREKVQALVVGADNFYTSSGLDFWFSPLPARVQRRPSVESSP